MCFVFKILGISEEEFTEKTKEIIEKIVSKIVETDSTIDVAKFILQELEQSESETDKLLIITTLLRLLDTSLYLITKYDEDLIFALMAKNALVRRGILPPTSFSLLGYWFEKTYELTEKEVNKSDKDSQHKNWI